MCESLDEARERLIDYIVGLVTYTCNNCKTEFYFIDDTAKFCPKCGSSDVRVEYERDVELLDWGWVRR